MNLLEEDLDDSALFCKTLIKRKTNENTNPKNSKQLKLSFSQSSINENRQIKNADEEKIKSSRNQKSNLNLDETHSSYFINNKSLNTCPLCLKSFKTDSSYSGHMKQCAKTHKMTTQQLLNALDLQKKQMQERRELGLCSQRTSLPLKITNKKKNKDPEQYDLALGLALSKSLTTTGTVVPVPPTLEEFGFTSKNLIIGQNRKKTETNKKTILRERTADERQRIIVEKVAVILLDENQGTEIRSSSNVQNNQVTELWSLCESDRKHGWYIDEIKERMLLEVENPPPEEPTKPTLPDNIDEEIIKLNLPGREIYKDWGKLINNKELSDLRGKTKDCQEVCMHSLVAFARCPGILQKGWETVCGKFNLKTILIFLEYLYCGTLNGLIRTEVDNLLELAGEFNQDELVDVLSCLKNNLESSEDSPKVPNLDVTVLENKKIDIFEERDLFTEDSVVDVTPIRVESPQGESENESNAEKSYWSFIQQDRKREANRAKDTYSEEKPASSKTTIDLQRNLTDDSATKDLDEVINKIDEDKASTDCIILSSDSEPKGLTKLSKTPSPANIDIEVPYFDPYDNFHCFSEEQFSPVGVHSQSLITGDISTESLKQDLGNENAERFSEQEELKKTVAYCSTPVTVRQHPSKINSSSKPETNRRKKKCDLTGSRILRKSLGLKARVSNPSSTKKRKLKNKESSKGKKLAEALAHSILHELSLSSPFQPSPAARRDMFMEVTPVFNREEFVDRVTPSPNYSNMGESLLKEQLAKYGLKRSLAKSKAKKILKHIYDELHPLYNTETGKIVKRMPGATQKVEKKTKASETTTKKAEPKRNKTDAADKTKQKKKPTVQSVSSEENSDQSMERLTNYDSCDSDFENLSETLTQSMPSNPVDLPSAFSEFLQSNPEYHQKILLYEPIWLEELQKKLKGTFKKHFKMSDLMDFLDQKCITFRSQAQARSVQKRNERRKENIKKRKNSS